MNFRTYGFRRCVLLYTQSLLCYRLWLVNKVFLCNHQISTPITITILGFRRQEFEVHLSDKLCPLPPMLLWIRLDIILIGIVTSVVPDPHRWLLSKRMLMSLTLFICKAGKRRFHVSKGLSEVDGTCMGGDEV